MATGKSTATFFRLISATKNGALKYYAPDVQADEMPRNADVAGLEAKAKSTKGVCPECGAPGGVALTESGLIALCISCGAVNCHLSRDAAKLTPAELGNIVIQALARAVLVEREEAGRLRDENEFLRARRVDACECEVPHGVISSTIDA